MSAIWGCINLRNESDISNIALSLEAKYKVFRIDRFDHISFHNAIYGCCHQYLTTTAHNDALPYLDLEKEILFTADCVLDNRDELLYEFCNLPADTPDGVLLYNAYIRWGKNFSQHVTGAFSFAAYHLRENKAVLATDHMANRSLFYTYNNGKLVFSTAIVPLAKTVNSKLSEKWATGCLSNSSADMMIFRHLTPYEYVYQIEAAHFLTFYSDSIDEYQYWNPLHMRIAYKGLTNEQYKQLLQKTLSSSIASMLRSPSETGCTLSSGLDSSTIACLSAPYLEKKNKKLYSYTSVPLKSFKSARDSYSTIDETEGVLSIIQKYPSIQPTFLDCHGSDAFSELPSLIPLIGYPMKSGQNLTWLNEIYRTAAKKDCKLILKGQFGNSSISYGTALGTIYQQLRAFHLIGAYRSAIRFSKVNKISKKQILRKFIYESIEKVKAPAFDTSQVLVSKELLYKYKVVHTIQNIQSYGGGGPMDSRKQRLRFLHDPYALAQLGMFDTIMGLIHGILIRDPAKDKNVIELCAQLPVFCGLADGWERGMIRSYMEGIVPERILKDTNHRGLQSADYIYRCRMNWDSIYPQVIKALEHTDIQYFLDQSLYETLINKLKMADSSFLTDSDIKQTNILYSFSLLIN